MSSGIAIVCCYVGSYTTKKYLRFADVSYESLWYRVPTYLQKYLVPILADAQRLQVFNGLGIIDVNLIAFMKVWLFHGYQFLEKVMCDSSPTSSHVPDNEYYRQLLFDV